jgi:hypothetical protein
MPVVRATHGLIAARGKTAVLSVSGSWHIPTGRKIQRIILEPDFSIVYNVYKLRLRQNYGAE